MTQSPTPDDYGHSPDLGGSVPSGGYGQSYASGQQRSGQVPSSPAISGPTGLYGDPDDSLVPAAPGETPLLHDTSLPDNGAPESQPVVQAATSPQSQGVRLPEADNTHSAAGGMETETQVMPAPTMPPSYPPRGHVAAQQPPAYQPQTVPPTQPLREFQPVVQQPGARPVPAPAQPADFHPPVPSAPVQPPPVQTPDLQETFQPQGFQPPAGPAPAPPQMSPQQGYQVPAPTAPPVGFEPPAQPASFHQAPPQMTYGQPGPGQMSSPPAQPGFGYDSGPQQVPAPPAYPTQGGADQCAPIPPAPQYTLASQQMPVPQNYASAAPASHLSLQGAPQPGHYPQPSASAQQPPAPQAGTFTEPAQFPPAAQPEYPATAAESGAPQIRAPHQDLAPQQGATPVPTQATGTVRHSETSATAEVPWYEQVPDDDGFSEPTTYALPQVHSAETLAGVNVVPPPQQYATPLWAPPIVKKAFPIAESIVAGFSILGIMALFAMYFAQWGFGLTTFVAVFAVPSLLVIVYILHLIDRWEGESWKSRLLSLGWGAGISTALSLFFNSAGSTIAFYATGSQDAAQGFGVAVVAPVVEEVFKGACVAFIVLARRHHLQSALDGVVHGGLVGAGFAFVENILYFGRAFSEYGSVNALFQTVFLRGVMSPFLHPMATSLTGLAIAWSVTRMRGRHSWTWMGLIGLLGGISLHGLWNFSAVMGWFFIVYILVMVPAFITWLVLLFIASSREAKEIAQGLQPYVATGWMLPSEVTMATHGPSRSRAMQWAKHGGPHSKKAMKKFLRSLCILGLDQQLMARTGPDQKRIDYDRDLLAEISTARNTFLSAHGISI